MFKKLAVAALGVAAVSAWDYSDPDEYWADEYPECGKFLQSPINIQTKEVKYKKSPVLPDLKLTGDLSLQEYTITHENYQVSLHGGNMDDIILEGGLMNNTYYLERVDFHWKSEHELDGKHKDAEAQFVFKLKEANKYNNGQMYTIYAVFLDKGKNKDLDNMFDNLSGLPDGEDTKVQVSLEELLPKKFDEDFYAYRGSFTTPPCTQKAEWYIGYKKVDISSDHLKVLERLIGPNGLTYKNYRPEQKLAARYVFKSFSGGSSSGGGSSNFFG